MQGNSKTYIVTVPVDYDISDFRIFDFPLEEIDIRVDPVARAWTFQYVSKKDIDIKERRAGDVMPKVLDKSQTYYSGYINREAFMLRKVIEETFTDEQKTYLKGFEDGLKYGREEH